MRIKDARVNVRVTPPIKILCRVNHIGPREFLPYLAIEMPRNGETDHAIHIKAPCMPVMVS